MGLFCEEASTEEPVIEEDSEKEKDGGRSVHAVVAICTVFGMLTLIIVACVLYGNYIKCQIARKKEEKAKTVDNEKGAINNMN